jgi:hypothetical protein
LKYFIYMYENRIMKFVKIVLKGWRCDKSNRGDKFDLSTLYAYMKISQ